MYHSLQITDFGQSVVMDLSGTAVGMRGQPAIMSPEMSRGERYDHKVKSLCSEECNCRHSQDIQKIRFVRHIF